MTAKEVLESIGICVSENDAKQLILAYALKLESDQFLLKRKKRKQKRLNLV